MASLLFLFLTLGDKKTSEQPNSNDFCEEKKSAKAKD